MPREIHTDVTEEYWVAEWRAPEGDMYEGLNRWKCDTQADAERSIDCEVWHPNGHRHPGYIGKAIEHVVKRVTVTRTRYTAKDYKELEQ